MGVVKGGRLLIRANNGKKEGIRLTKKIVIFESVIG